LVSVIFFTEAFADFADQVEVAVALILFTILLTLVPALLIHVGATLHFVWYAEVGIAFALLLLGQATDTRKWVIIVILHEAVIPDTELCDPVVLHIGIEQGVVVCGVEAFATEFRHSGSFDGNDVADLHSDTTLAHVTPKGQ
jgi:hypothetical protein